MSKKPVTSSYRMSKQTRMQAQSIQDVHERGDFKRIMMQADLAATAARLRMTRAKTATTGQNSTESDT